MQATPVANWFIQQANMENIPVTQLQLQKLLYLAESAYGSTTGSRLFDKDFQAWKYGPVNVDLYRSVKKYGNQPISQTIAGSYSESLPEEITDFLETIWEYFKVYSGTELVSLTHEVGPWEEFYTSKSTRGTQFIPAQQVHSSWNDFLSQASQRKMREKRISALSDLKSHKESPVIDSLTHQEDLQWISALRYGEETS